MAWSGDAGADDHGWWISYVPAARVGRYLLADALSERADVIDSSGRILHYKVASENHHKATDLTAGPEVLLAGELAELFDEAPERSAGDARLFAALQSVGFAGAVWEKFAVKLVKYGIGVLQAWMASGHFFEVIRYKGIPFTPSTRESDRLVYDARFRDALVQMAVVTALDTFRRRCVEGTGWRAEGGAALTTYFVVGCLHATTNELRKLRRADERARKSHEAAVREEHGRPSQDHHVADPSQQAIDNLILHEYLAQLPQRDRNIVWGKACGYSNREIAEFFGERSARAVEQRWSTLTKNVEWIGRLAGKESK